MEIIYLLSLTANEIERGVFPLRQLLENSLYYPACDLDGGVIRYCNQHFPQLNICSFVYVDSQDNKCHNDKSVLSLAVI